MGATTRKRQAGEPGSEQITIGFVRYTLKPHLVRWEEELNRKLFRRAGPFVEFEISGLLRGDAKAQADYYKAALGGPGSGPGWMSVNEIRSLQNLAPIDGADKPFYPDTGKTNAKNRLLNLFKANAQAETKLRAEIKGDAAHIYLYDVIDAWFGVSAQMMVDALKSASGKPSPAHQFARR